MPLIKTLLKEIEDFRNTHPDIDEVDLICTDLSANTWGKRYPISLLPKLTEQLKMPQGNFIMSPLGTYIEVLEYCDTDGDPDVALQLIPGTLKVMPWQNTKRAQVMVTSALTESPFVADPRAVLQNVLDKLKAENMKPTVAFELEFYLIDATRDQDNLIQPPKNPVNGQVDTMAILGLDRLDMFEDVLRDIRDSCNVQGIETTAYSAEMGKGQFEINLNHSTDCMKAADDVIMYKRLIKGVAKKHGFDATFLAKPYLDQAGNGMHVHVSMYDDEGNNQFAQNDQATLKHAVAGCLETMPAALSMLAANPNAYRRYMPNHAVATQVCWAVENRTVAVRIPDSDLKNTRIEHRVASADANPYLTMAVLLAGIYHGLKNKLDPGAPFEGNACEEHTFPRTLDKALDELEKSDALKEVMGERFIEVYLANKRSEIVAFHNAISAREYDWYL